MRIGRLHAVAIALLLASTAAHADDKDPKSHGADHGDHGRGHGGHEGREHGGHDDADDEDNDEDGGAPVVDKDRTPAQEDFRKKLMEREHALVNELAKHPGKHASMQDRQAIGMHWRHVMRLLRIRELAERAKDAAIVKRADELIDLEDKKFRAKMTGAAAPTTGADAGAGGAK